MKPCFLFWKNAAKQMTPAPPATVAMTDAAMLPLLNGLPSNCAGRGGRGRARAEAYSQLSISRVDGVAERGRSDVGPRVDASGSTQRSASKMSSPSHKLKAGERPLIYGRGATRYRRPLLACPQARRAR